jgi:hypothetical protein
MKTYEDRLKRLYGKGPTHVGKIAGAAVSGSYFGEFCTVPATDITKPMEKRAGS